MSLKEISKNQNLKKQIFPYKFSCEKNLNYIGVCPEKSFFNSEEDYIFFSKENTFFDFKKKSIEYCENDVIITQKAIINIKKIVSSINKKIFDKSYSAPSLSHKIFFLNFNNKKIEKEINKDKGDYIRNSYYGGRCEVFGNSKESEIIKYYDFTGMYAQCMKEKFHFGDFKFDTSKDFTKTGFHTILYESDMKIPILPYHYKNKLFFPNGKLIGCF
jgi:hypothetical protein